ncbi:transcriptional regulator [Acuticoccus sediminis]|uniref:Transcriptional regulator n=1 Tax=Acuticoccus sediminis TaxID=2184697 RepID=A0A8B2NWS2_9HYPH|nr:metalloregulator ArsR/SmtB family transcription factor [Acuticoccus sediminis]RAI03291.1 transcriptional regulator [Acuticoccus sediminis]
MPAATTPELSGRAAKFAALGDPTRLSLVAMLSDGGPRSIVSLAEGVGLTRQGTTKHLKVMQDAGLVASRREGRETRFTLRRDALAELREHLDLVSAQWDDALDRLKAFVERPG